MKKIVFLIIAITFLVSCKGNKNTTSSTPDSDSNTKKEKPSKSNAATNKKLDEVIKTARSYGGTPYKYGGTTRAGIDCSGFTCASYKSIDISLPRVASDQSNVGKVVSLSELKKGDLIFFTDKKGNKKITHVGLVTEVKNDGTAKFIHASTKLGVVETDLFSNYYKPLILKAVRVL